MTLPLIGIILLISLYFLLKEINKPKVIREKLDKLNELQIDEQVADLEEIILSKETILNKRKENLNKDEYN